MNKLIVLFLVASIISAGCGGKTRQGSENQTGTDTDTLTETGAMTGTSTDTGTMTQTVDVESELNTSELNESEVGVDTSEIEETLNESEDVFEDW